MANRGLAGSGLASDQDTRLLLAKQRDLAGVYRNAQTQSQSLNNQYTDQLNNAYQQLAAINPDATAADLFNKYYTDGQKSLNDQFKSFVDLYNWATPSGNNTQDNQTKLFEWNNVSAKDMLQNTQFYDKLNQDGKIEAAKLALNLKQFDLDVAKVMGVDQNGNPTLDAQKLYEEMRHNQASEGIASANVSLGAARLQQSIASAQQKANMDMLKLQNSQWGKQGQLLKSLADSKLSLASRALEAVKANPDDYGAKTEYEAAIRDANAAQKALEAVANGSDASSAYSQSQGNYATSWGGI
jgi:Ca2+-binding EF-hand superfamily protein